MCLTTSDIIALSLGLPTLAIAVVATVIGGLALYPIYVERKYSLTLIAELCHNINVYKEINGTRTEEFKDLINGLCTVVQTAKFMELLNLIRKYESDDDREYISDQVLKLLRTKWYYSKFIDFTNIDSKEFKGKSL